MVKFHETLSEESVYNRYFAALKLSQRVAHERLTRICFNDYDREIALVAELKVPKGEEKKILGVGRLSKQHGPARRNLPCSSAMNGSARAWAANCSAA